MFNIQEQQGNMNIFQLSNPVAFVSTIVSGPENHIIKLTWAT